MVWLAAHVPAYVHVKGHECKLLQLFAREQGRASTPTRTHTYTHRLACTQLRT